jgi:ubiquinone biosynthesis protein
VARPIIGKPLNEISVAALLGQMFKIAAEFEMETQPQLLLMQKTLMVAEGVGRMLNPNLNMWELARPMIEEWAAEHFSKKAQLKFAAKEARNYILQMPLILDHTKRALKSLGDEKGLMLHPDSIKEIQASRSYFHRQWLIFAWSALGVAVLYLIF